MRTEYDWLEHVREVISRDKLGDGEQISWSAYHASSIQDATDNPNKTLGCFLPMFEKILSQ